MLRLLSLLIILAVPAKAEEIVLGLSQDEVAITANFNGSDILVLAQSSATNLRRLTANSVSLSPWLVPMSPRQYAKKTAVWGSG